MIAYIFRSSGIFGGIFDVEKVDDAIVISTEPTINFSARFVKRQPTQSA